MCEKLAHRIRNTSAPFLHTDDETGSDDEGAAPRCCKRTIKSGKLCTRDTHVGNTIKWPHEMVSSSMGQAPMYKDMSLALFLNGHLAIVAGESSVVKDTMLKHLRELFEDVEVYCWVVVREYHATWIQLLEQGWATSGDASKRAHGME